MDFQIIEPPQIDEPLVYSYKVSQKNKEEYARRKKRAKELGIHLFILDEDDMPDELRELEQFIVDNYINMDLDVPNDVKKKYIELKKIYKKE